jgi:serine/threonine protein kinase
MCRERPSFEEQYQLTDKVGMGQFSNVKCGVSKKDGQQYAIKILNKSRLNVIERRMLKRELEIVQLVAHPNVVRFFGVHESSTHAYIISELLHQGNLRGYLETHPRMDETQVALTIYFLLEAVRYLHSCGVIHRDIKPDNVLVETDPQGNITNAKLIDFGFANVVLPGQVLLEQCGTLTYLAPEVLQKHGYSMEADLWSVGITLYVL